MIEFCIAKNEYHSNREGNFKIKVNVYEEDKSYIDKNRYYTLLEGEYLRESERADSYEVDYVINKLKELGIYKPNCVIFNSINIDRELTKEEIKNLKAISDFAGQEYNNNSISIEKVYKQGKYLDNAIDIMMDNQKIKNLLPVNIDLIAFISIKNTEADFVLKHKAKLIDSRPIITYNTINVYLL